MEWDEEKEETLSINDAYGRSYRLHIYERWGRWTLTLWCGEERAGRCLCYVSGDSLEVGDLEIVDRRSRQRNQHVLSGFALWRKQPVNYQRRGLGTALIKFVIERARMRRLRAVNGRLAPIDLAASS